MDLYFKLERLHREKSALDTAYAETFNSLNKQFREQEERVKSLLSVLGMQSVHSPTVADISCGTGKAAETAEAEIPYGIPEASYSFPIPQKVNDELLVYIDPGFFSDWGHYISFATLIHEEAKKRKVDLWHFTTDDVSEENADRFSLIKLFKYRAILGDDNGLVGSVTTPGDFSFLDAVSKRLFDDHTNKVLFSFRSAIESILDAVLSGVSPYRKVSVYMYTSHPLYIALFAEMLGLPEYQDLPLTAHLCLFYLNLEFCNGKKVPEYEALLRLTSQSLEKYDLKGKIKVYADSERTIGLYSSYFRRQIHLSPIPLNREPVSFTIKETQKTEKIIIGFFGFAHEKQGYPLMFQLYERLSHTKAFANVHFIVRHNTKFTTQTMVALSRIFQGKTERITHLTGNFLSPGEYETHLNACDVVVIPHSRKHYPCQTSGLFTDALIKAKIVIVPQDTWMADQLSKYGAGETFISNSSESFEAAVERVISNIDVYKPRVSAKLNEFVKFHTIGSLFDTIECGGQLHEGRPVGGSISSGKPRLLTEHARKEALAASNQLLSKFRQKHRGQRCVIIGNGPSLNKMDLSFLKNEISFGMNRIYLGFEKWGFIPTYYVVVNRLVIQQSVQAILDIPAPKFLSIYGYPYIPEGEEIIFLQSLWGPLFSRDPRDGLCEGHTVTYVAMQLAYFMGFSEVILIGVDHNFVTPGNPNQEVISDGSDPNHFHPDYFGKGTHWQLPDLKNSEVAYRLAKCVFESEGRKVVDATADGKLTIFPKVDYRELFYTPSHRADVSHTPKSIRDIEDLIYWKPADLPLVSVIVCADQEPNRLRKTINSVNEQVYPNVETVLVCNQKIGKLEFLNQALSKRPIRKVILEKSVSKGGMRNAGLRQSSGDYITYLDEGDCYTADHIAGLASFLQAHTQFAVAYVRAKESIALGNGGNFNTTSQEPLTQQRLEKEKLPVNNSIPYLSFMHTRSMLDQVGYFREELTSLSSWDFLIRLSLKSDFAGLPIETAESLWKPDENQLVGPNIEKVIQSYKEIYSTYANQFSNEIHKSQQEFLSSLREYPFFSGDMGVRRWPAGINSVMKELERLHQNSAFSLAGELLTDRIIPFLAACDSHISQGVQPCTLPISPASLENAADKSTKQGDSNESHKTKAVIATSIAPFGIERQKLAIASWFDMGFEVISLNCDEEIRQIASEFPKVSFIAAQRDARVLCGKPLVFFDDILKCLRESDADVCGIVNSDILFNTKQRLIPFLVEEVPNSLVIGSRVDVASFDNTYGTLYPIGFDYFFFDRSLASRYPKEDFGMGLPWWDYWAPFIPLTQDVPVKEIIPPIGYHCRHSFNWSQEMYSEFAVRFNNWITQNNIMMDINQDVVAQYGNNHALFLAVLKYIHDNSQKISLDGEECFTPWATDTNILYHLKHLHEIEKDYSRGLRLDIIKNYVQVCIEKNPCFLSNYLTISNLYAEKAHQREALDIAFRLGINALNTADVLNAKHAFSFYLHLLGTMIRNDGH